MTNNNKSKRYYWIKIKTDFLNSDKVDFLISQDGGNGFAYVVLYQCLCMKAINTSGLLCSKIGDIIVPLDFAKLKRDLKWFTLEQIQRAFELFSKLGLIYKDDETGLIAISDFNEIVGSETLQAIEKRQSRLKKNIQGIEEQGEEYTGGYTKEYTKYIKRLDIRDKILDTRYKSIDIRNNNNIINNSTNNLTNDKTDKTDKRILPNSILQTLLNSSYITEDEMTDYWEMLNEFCERSSYGDLKVKVDYFIRNLEENDLIQNKYLYLKKSLERAYNRKTPTLSDLSVGG